MRTATVITLMLVSCLLAAAPANAAGVQASFDFAPAAPAPGQQVVFTATSTSDQTGPIQHDWDLDGDGQYDDASGPTATAAFGSPGTYLVGVRASQQLGGAALADTEVRAVQVGGGAPPPQGPGTGQGGNRPPVARYNRRCKAAGTLFYCRGLTVKEGVEAELDASLSSDPDGQIVRYEWDLDGNGSFERDGGSSPTVKHTFERHDERVFDLRKRRIAVRVTDDDGATAVDQVTLTLAPPPCLQSARVGDRMLVESTCVRRQRLRNGKRRFIRYTAQDVPVVINGITIVPAKDYGISIEVPDFEAKLKLPSTWPKIRSQRATVSMAAGGGTPVRLYQGKVDWRLTGTNRLSGFEIGAGARINGLRVTDSPAPPLLPSYGVSKLDVYVALPAQFGGATSSKPLRLGSGAPSASAGGPLSFEVPSAALGPIGLSNLKVTYDGVDLWVIKAGVALPPPTSAGISGEAGIRSDGSFHHAAAEVNFGNPGIGPFGPVPVYLQRIAFRVEVNPKKSECVPHVGKVKKHDWFGDLPKNTPGGSPQREIDYGHPTFALCGDVGLTGGGMLLGRRAVGIDGRLGFVTFDDRPSVLRAYGELRLAEIPVADGEIQVHTDGYISIRGEYDWGLDGVFGISGGLDVDMLGSKFSAGVRGDACIEFVGLCRGFRGAISTKGVAVCFRIDFEVWEWTPGIGYRWGEAFPTIYLDGCDVGPYKEHIKRAARASQAGERAVDLPAGLPGAVIAAEGRDAAPTITLIGPRGERISTPPGPAAGVEGDGWLLLKDPRSKLTQVAIAKPSAGRWRVVVEDGSPELVSLRSAEGLPEPEVEASVKGRGHRRALRYRVGVRKGQKVTFVEQGPSTGTILGTARGASGTLRFRPADGKAERRSIYAVVEQDGMPRGRIKVASYRAPGALKPRRVRGLRARRSGKRLLLAWRRASGARRYRVVVRLSDGRVLVRTTAKRRLTVRRVPRRVRARAKVRGISAAGVLGR